MPDGRSISGNQLLDALDQLVPVAERSDPDLLQVLVAHLRENVDGYLFPVKHLPQLLQAKGGEEGPDAHVEAGLAGHHLRLGEVQSHLWITTPTGLQLGLINNSPSPSRTSPQDSPTTLHS